MHYHRVWIPEQYKAFYPDVVNDPPDSDSSQGSQHVPFDGGDIDDSGRKKRLAVWLHKYEVQIPL